MMKNQLTLIIYLILTSFASNLTFAQLWPEVKINSQARSISRKVDKNSLISMLRSFSLCCLPNRTSGQKGNQQALQYLIKEIEKRDNLKQGKMILHKFKPNIEYAIKHYEAEFQENVAAKQKSDSREFKLWRAATSNIQNYLKGLADIELENLVWIKNSPNKEANSYIVFANFDSVVFNSSTQKIEFTKNNPGANDNATGVIALLEMIRLFSNIELQHNLHIVFTNTQEIGYLGAKAYVEDILKDKEIAGAFHFLMLGQDTKLKDKLARYGNYKIYTRKNNNAELKLAKKFREMADNVTKYIDYSILDNNFQLSDHTEFWKADIPTIVITQDFENDYNPDLHHNSNDLVEAVNAKSYYLAVKGSIGAISAFLLSK